MRTAKLFGNGLLSLSLVCWIVGCNAEDEVDTNTAPSMAAPTGTGGGEDHEHADGEDHEHADHEDAEGEDHEHADEDTEGDAQASTDSLELPETTAVDTEETELDHPVVEAGSGTDA